jgi:putative ABC transport system permease protein
VNRQFVSRLPIGDRSPLGIRFRYANGAEEKWYQIVGVVEDFPGFAPAPFSPTTPTIYHAAAPGELHPFFLSIRFEHDLPPGITDRIRQIAAEVDPSMQLRKATPLSTYYDEVLMFWRYLAWGVGAVTASVLLLSAAGIYAMMSFAIARRTREIGIRAALGATTGRLLGAIFGRALRQLGIGLVAGSLLPVLVFYRSGFGLERSAALLAAVAVIMLVVGVLAAIGPARRGLRIQPTEALRAD